MKKIFVLIIAAAFTFNTHAQTEDKAQNNIGSNIIQPLAVTIGGNFIVTGTFTATNGERVDHFITTVFMQAQRQAIGSLSQLESIQKVKTGIQNYPLRNITLLRAKGDKIKIDLLRFRLTGDFKNNPYLMNDDVIIFPFYDTEKDIIDISGAVNNPIKFQFVEGDKLSDAILFAGGLNNTYDNITQAEISRLDNTGNKEQLITVNINDDYQLKPGDRIKILADENQRKNYKVLVLGQVTYPGFVYVKKDGSYLKDVIERAGGFKPNADLLRAEVIRDYNSLDILQKYKLAQDFVENPEKLLLPEVQLKLKQEKASLELLRTSNLTEEDTLFFNIDNRLRILQSESLVDFTQLYDSTSDAYKFKVKDGDLILVPDKFNYVYVFGQVANAGYVKYNPEANYKYYINKAGGKTELARSDDEVVVIKGKGKSWITEQKEKLKLEPGDFIYVPKEIPRTTWYYVGRIGTVAGIVGSVATIVLLLRQFGK
ncbi:SLBB domain-containing protein [Melioribacteraceae bacterium 4301-Me]|uniref:SLBB domain-containing protein n=1 Tax=Pyranulibacter aquaticus TaxID=3163344 RepID=UPI00359BAE43